MSRTLPLLLLCAATSCVRNEQLPVPAGAAPSFSAADHRAIWERAHSVETYLSSPGVPRARWLDRHAKTVVREDFQDRVNVLPGQLRLLALVAAECAACEASIPVVARLAESTPGLELRVMDIAEAASVAGRRGVPEGLVAPHVIILDEQYTGRGCWSGDALPPADARGTSILSLVVDRLESARRGELICP